MSAPLPRHIPSSWLQALDVTKRCNTSSSSHSISQHKCAPSFFFFTPNAFCFIWDLCDGHFTSSPRTPSKHTWGSSAPLTGVHNSHPGGWIIKDGSLSISHSLQGNNPNLEAYRGKTNMNQPTSHIPGVSSTMVSQSCKLHRHQFSQITVVFKRLQQAMDTWLMTSHYTSTTQSLPASALLSLNFKRYYIFHIIFLP